MGRSAARLQANEAQIEKHPAVADGNLAVAVASPPLYHGSLAWNPVPSAWGKIREAFAQAVEQEELKLRKEATWGKNITTSQVNHLDEATIRRKAARLGLLPQGPHVRCVRTADHQTEAS